MHIDDGLLEALLDEQLDAPQVSATFEHVAACAECRSRLEVLRADDDLLRTVLPRLDLPTTPIALGTIVARARRQRRPLRWAAAIAALLLGAGALYAIPGSPVRKWIDRTIGRSALQPELHPTAPAAGVAMIPGARFYIVFGERTSGTVTIGLTDSATIAAQRTDGGGRGTARFVAGIDSLRIDADSAPAAFRIDIPRRTPWVEVLVGTRRVFLKDGPRVVAAVPPDSLGRYTLPLAERP